MDPDTALAITFMFQALQWKKGQEGRDSQSVAVGLAAAA